MAIKLPEGLVASATAREEATTVAFDNVQSFKVLRSAKLGRGLKSVDPAQGAKVYDLSRENTNIQAMLAEQVFEQEIETSVYDGVEVTPHVVKNMGELVELLTRDGAKTPSYLGVNVVDTDGEESQLLGSSYSSKGDPVGDKPTSRYMFRPLYLEGSKRRLFSTARSKDPAIEQFYRSIADAKALSEDIPYGGVAAITQHFRDVLDVLKQGGQVSDISLSFFPEERKFFCVEQKDGSLGVFYSVKTEHGTKDIKTLMS